MEADSLERVEIPSNFEDAPVEDLVQLIGITLLFHPSSSVVDYYVKTYVADMLDRLMSHNDLIPLSPYVSSCFLSSPPKQGFRVL